jgi:AraC-like DNA-binding protein
MILLIRPLRNKRANRLLLFLLTIILLTNLGNAWTTTSLYREIPFPSLYTRGMVLLLGPVIYFYSLSSIDPAFTLKRKHLIHLAPYILVLVINLIRLQKFTRSELIIDIDAFVAGNARIGLLSGLLFFAYSIHILMYLFLIYQTTQKTLQQQGTQYIISLHQRANWLKNISRALGLIGIIFLVISIYLLFNSIYTIEGNIIYTTALALLVYLVSYQAIKNNDILTPGFEKKYRSQKLDDETKEKIIAKIQYLLGNEKLFTDQNLTISLLGERAGTQSYIVSQLINERLNKTFTELLNEYRIEEFKKRIIDPDYQKYSITGLASEIGYNSKSAFNTAFKKITGQTPSEYIKGLQ